MENPPETTATSQEPAAAEAVAATAVTTAVTAAATAAIDAATRLALYQSAFLLLSRPLGSDSPAAAMQLIEELRPRKEDFARVFIGEAAERAQLVYAGLYAAPRPIEHEPQQTTLRLFLATAVELRDQGPQALSFPGGYKDIVEFLQPDTLWVHWKYTAPHTASGIAYDGLVRIDDRWVWFPKPYRFLRKAAAAPTPIAPEAPVAEAPKSTEPTQEKEPAQSANIWKE